MNETKYIILDEVNRLLFVLLISKTNSIYACFAF